VLVSATAEEKMPNYMLQCVPRRLAYWLIVLDADRKGFSFFSRKIKSTEKAISFSCRKIKENKKDPTFSAENEK